MVPISSLEMSKGQRPPGAVCDGRAWREAACAYVVWRAPKVLKASCGQHGILER